MASFVICNHFTTKVEIPKLLYAFCGRLHTVFFCCFPPSKSDDKKGVIVENHKFKKSVDQESTTAACVSINKTIKKEKPKCNFRNRCKSCQADFDKNKAKVKNKKDIEARWIALNYFVFLWILLFMFVSNTNMVVNVKITELNLFLRI